MSAIPHRFRVGAVLAWASLLAAQDAAVEPWPAANGPFGTYRNPATGLSITDPSQAKLLWHRDDLRIGMAKSNSKTWKEYFDRKAPPGSSSSPIIAAGKVFCVSFRPRGAVPSEGSVTVTVLKQTLQESAFAALAADQALLATYAGVSADDVIVAVDLQTGKTVWEMVEADRGINHPMGKRIGFGASPVFAQGVLYAMTSTGRIMALDAATGAKRWEMEDTPLYALRAKTKAAGRYGDDMGMESSLIVVDDMLIVPDFIGYPMGLIGIDTATGAKRWHTEAVLHPQSTASFFHEAGKGYLLAGSTPTPKQKATLRCLDAQTGAVVWSLDTLAAMRPSLTPNRGHLPVYLPCGVESLPAAQRPECEVARLGLARISASTAEVVWSSPDEPAWWFKYTDDMGSTLRAQIVGDKLFYYHDGLNPPGVGGRNAADAYAPDAMRVFSFPDMQPIHVELAGQGGENAHIGIGYNRYVDTYWLSVPNINHPIKDNFELQIRSTETYRLLGSPWKPPIKETGGYTVPIECPIAGGLMVFRTEEGGLACFDLRAAP
jgi:outer membrane protein assembly factor BamB